MGEWFSAIWGLVISCLSLFFSLFSYINPLVLSVASIVLGFAGLITIAKGYIFRQLTGFDLVDLLLLAWSSICCAMSSISSILTLKNNGYLGPD